MRALLIGGETKAEVRRVLDFAEKPENYYIVGADGFTFQRPPGDDPRHVAHLPVGFRAVFSITKATAEGGKLYRHLSVSIQGPKWPNPAAAFMIASLFGFPGYDERNASKPGPDWILDKSDREHCIVIVSPREGAA